MRAAPRAASASVSEPVAGAGDGPGVSRDPTRFSSADFQRALATRPHARSEHFVLHHCPKLVELSTGGTANGPDGVDEPRRFGQLIPKRHARRAVTRSLLKRQGRAAWQRHARGLRAGDWLLRLRGGFDPARYPSAASDALRLSVRVELDALFAQAGRRPAA